jgi:uncharacterized protein
MRPSILPPSPAEALPAPLRTGDRLFVLDLLRGLALLGIFVMNMPSFGGSLFAERATGVAPFLRDLFIGGKFNAMFALLFGIGFALQFGRLEAAEPARASRVYLRRLLVLMALGLLHAIGFWSGDVLFVYALLGLALLWARRLSDRALVAIIVAGVLFPAYAVYLRPLLLSEDTETLAIAEYHALRASNDMAYGHGSFADAVRENRRMFAWAYGSPLGQWSMASFYVQMGTPLLLGYLIGRRGWVARAGTLLPAMRRWRNTALLVGFAASLVFLLAGIDSQEPTSQSALLNQLQTLGRLGLMCGYALSLALLAQDVRWRRRLAPLAAAGRMPLSNYLLQTAMATFVFHGWGLAQWGRLGTLAQIALAVGLFTLVQLPLSVAWLRRFDRGPLEALWRRITYGERPRPARAP